MKKNVLIVGSGGREHATCLAFLKSNLINKLYLAPGNDGIFYGHNYPKKKPLLINQKVECIKDVQILCSIIKKQKIDLVFVGPEKPLSLGIINAFEKKGIAAVGPSKKAARLESSKAWAKDVMNSLDIPIPEYAHFDNCQKAEKYILSRDYPVVVKADGLASGKGSIVTDSYQEALEAVDLIMKKKKFGQAGDRVVIEKRLKGEEFSFFAFTDGKTVLPMAWAMDYKPVFDDDQGLNTGGMGGYSPYREKEKDLTEKIMEKVAIPLIKGCRKHFGFVYKGILYIGGTFFTEKKQVNPYVFEINVRMGDPEAQVIYPRLKTDLVSASMAIVDQTLNKISLDWDDNYYVCICATSGRTRGKKGWYKGYPARYSIGKPISGLENVSKKVTVIHSGTKWDKKHKQFVTNGGRVLSIVASAQTLKKARKKAYKEIEKIHFDGIHYRRDIGR